MKNNFFISLLCTMIIHVGLRAQGSWSLSGNAGIVPGVQFLGTTDLNPLSFRVNAQRAGIIDPVKMNTALGYTACGVSPTGTNNTAIGANALFSLSSGNNNTAIGQGAMRNNGTAGDNTALGAFAMHKNTSGLWNTAIGHNSMYSNTIASANTALGDMTMYSNLTGSGNTAIGEDALRRNTSGSNNTALGENAMNYNVSGSNNTAVGRGTAIVNFNNATALGYMATVTAHNKIRLGNTSIVNLESQVNLSVTSDGRFKRNLRQDVKGLDFILRLRPVTYTYDIEALNNFYGVPDRIRDDAEKGGDKTAAARELQQLDLEAAAAGKIRHTGFIAQEVEEAALESGFEFTGVVKPQNERDHYGIRYAEFTVPLVKAVQEQQVIIEQQQARIDRLEQMVQQLADRAGEAAETDLPGFQVAPNPTSGAFTMTFSLQNASKMNVYLFDTAGSLKQTIDLGDLQQGTHHLALHIEHLPSGTYFIHMVMNGQPVSRKIVVLK